MSLMYIWHKSWLKGTLHTLRIICFLLAEVGCVHLVDFFSLCQLDTCIYVVLFFHVHIFVNVLSCFHVCIDCKNTLLCGGNKEYLYIYPLTLPSIYLRLLSMIRTTNEHYN